MCNNFPSRLDEQRIEYVYNGLNVVLKLLARHLDTEQKSIDTLSEAYKKADAGSIIGMAAMALKNKAINQQQYEKIFDIAMGINTVETTATVEEPTISVFAELEKLLIGK